MFDRLVVAWRILSGAIALGEDGALHCNRRHVSGDEEAVKKSYLRQLERASDDLKIARGVIGGAGKTRDYNEVCKSTLE